MKETLQKRHLCLPLGRNGIYASNFYYIINNLRLQVIRLGVLKDDYTGNKQCKNVVKQVVFSE